MPIKNVDDMQALNVVLQLLSNIVPFSYYFLLRLSHKAIKSNCHLSIHINNILNELWFGTEDYCIPWDLIKLFKLHYLKNEKYTNPINILKFIIAKVNLELTQQDPKEEILFQVNNEIIHEYPVKLNKKNERIEPSKSIISYLFDTIEEITCEVDSKTTKKYQATPLINLELPDFSGCCVLNPANDIFETLEATCEFYIKINKVESEIQQNEMWKEMIEASTSILKLYSIVARYLDQILSTTISREAPKVSQFLNTQNITEKSSFQVIDTLAKTNYNSDQFSCIKLFVVSLNTCEWIDNKELKECKFKTVSELVHHYSNKSAGANQQLKKSLFISGYCEAAAGVEIEIILNQRNDQSKITTDKNNNTIEEVKEDTIEHNDYQQDHRDGDQDSDDITYLSDSEITHCTLPIESLIKYRERTRHFWDGERLVKQRKKFYHFSSYRIFILDRKFTSENQSLPECRKMMSAIRNTYQLDLSRIHKDLGSCVGILYTNDDVLNDFEFIAFNNTRGQWVKYKDAKLVTYEAFKDIESNVFTNCTVLVYKNPELEYQEMRTKSFFNSIT